MPDPIQLGVAGICVAILGWILKLFIDGKIHTDSEIKVFDKRIADRDARIEELLESNATLTSALAASNEQSKTVIALFKALQSGGEED